MKEMTIEQLVLSMLQAAYTPVTESEYRVLGISKLNIFKRKKYSNIYRTLILYLIKLSIPGAFPRCSSELLERFNDAIELAYKDNKSTKKTVEERFEKFESLVKIGEKEPFMDVALYIAGIFEKSPKKYAYSILLNKNIDDMFLNFLTLGQEIKIKTKQEA